MPDWSVGPAASDDFRRWSDGWEYLNTIDPLADDHTFIQTGDIIENSWPVLGTNRLDFNNHTVRFTCPWEDSHQGNPNRGFMTHMSGGNGRITVYADNVLVEHHFQIDGLNIDQEFGNNVELVSIGSWHVGAIEDIMRITARDLLIKGFGTANGTGFRVRGGNRTYANCFNMKIWDIEQGFSGFLTGAIAAAYQNRKFAENITVYNTGIRNFYFNNVLSNEWEVRNCVSAVVGGGFNEWVGMGNGRLRIRIHNCADADGSCNGVAVKNNIVTADEFKSLIDTNDNFLDIIDGTIED